MPLPVLLSVATGGILLVVLLVYFIWGTTPIDVGDEVSLAAKLQHELPGHELSDLLVAADYQTALAQDVTNGDILVFYTHGIHVNLRAFPPSSLRSVRLLEDAEGASLQLQIDAYDRDLFVLALGQDTDNIEQARAWEARLREETS